MHLWDLYSQLGARCPVQQCRVTFRPQPASLLNLPVAREDHGFLRKNIYIYVHDAYRHGHGKSHSQKRMAKLIGAIGLQQQSPGQAAAGIQSHLLAAAVARKLKQRAGEESGDGGRDLQAAQNSVKALKGKAEKEWRGSEENAR